MTPYHVVRQADLKDYFVDIVYEWKHSWSNQTQNSTDDFENYRRRAFGIDANMVHSLARRISERVAANENVKLQKLRDKIQEKYESTSDYPVEKFMKELLDIIDGQ